MSYTIGNLTFAVMRGHPVALGEVVEDISRPGEDGHAVRRLGRRGPPFQVETTVDLGSAVSAQEAAAAYASYKGSIVAMTDGTNCNWTKVLVLEVRATWQPAPTIAGGLNEDSAWVLHATWDLQIVDD
jgi:hypothetical protein